MIYKYKTRFRLLGVKMRECPLCGAEVEDDDVYCTECGTDFDFE